VLNSESCTCGGSNENCYICFGSGTRQRYEFRPAPLRLRELNRSFSRATSEAQRMLNGERPQYFGFHVIPESPRHAGQRSRIGLKTSVRRQVSRSAVQRTIKPQTNRRASEKEMSKANGTGPRELQAPTYTRMAAIRRGLIKPMGRTPNLIEGFATCSLCKTQVKTTNLPKHVRKVHPGIHATRPLSSSSSRDEEIRSRNKKVIEVLGPSQEIISQHQFHTIDLREAHRHMGFFARDNGRFGSHPLHDRFDDESEP
jgi:hypothetical protein